APDVLVAVDARAEALLRVVQVERDDARDADRRVELGDRRGVAPRRAEVVARGERVLRVDADAEPIAVRRRVDERREVREAPADLRPLPRRVLERDRRRIAAAGAQHLPEGAPRGPDAGRVAGARVRAGMADEVRDPEPGAALELVRELGDGPPAEGLVGRRRIEEVAVVREERAYPARCVRRVEGAHVVVRDHACGPLARRASEDLHRLAAGADAALEGPVEAAGDRLVRAEERHPLHYSDTGRARLDRARNRVT